MSRTKSSVRIEENLDKDFDRLTQETGKTKTDLINDALRLYRDSYYMKNKASFLNENILDMVRGLTDRMEMKINHKSNQLISELCIELCIMEQVLAASIQVDSESIAEYRKTAVEFLKTNQRVFRMDEVI